MKKKSENFSFYCSEISSKKSKGGKRELTLILHEIFADESEWQDNGITWVEEYTLQNIGSLKGSPLAVEFIDDEKTEMWNHGLVGEVDGVPIFESDIVGSFFDAYIGTIEQDGKEKKVLIGKAYVYEQRYKKFTDWLIENVPKGNVRGSVEITGLPENENKIIYRDGYKEQGRIPMEYCYSGHALLSSCVQPADKSAIVLEINENRKTEEKKMDEKILTQFVSDIKGAIIETNSKNKEYEDEISELNSKNVELNATVEQLTSALESAKKEISEYNEKYDILWKEVEILREEIAKAKIKEKVGELNSILSEFTDEEKNLVKAEIEAFNEKPEEIEINSVIEKLYSEIGKLAKKTEVEKKAEQNSMKFNENDIFGEVVNEDNSDEDVSIF